MQRSKTKQQSTTTNNKSVNDMKRQFSKDGIEHMTEFPPSLAVREMKMNALLCFHLIPIIMPAINKSEEILIRTPS